MRQLVTPLETVLEGEWEDLFLCEESNRNWLAVKQIMYLQM